MNPADILTEHLSRESMERYTSTIGAVKAEGRSEKAAQLQHLQRKGRRLKAQLNEQ